MEKQNVYVDGSVAAVTEMYQDLIGEDSYMRTIAEQLHLLAGRLEKGHKETHLGAFVELSNWLPNLVGKSKSDVWSANLDKVDYLTAIAREYGYKNWDEVQIESIQKPSIEFEKLVDAALDGEIESIQGALRTQPSLVNNRSHWRHRSTPLHYMAANGVETYRQRVPRNAVEIVKTLIQHGADVNALADMYGGNQSVLNLLITSQHPAEAGVTNEIKKVLIDAGAKE
jgi:hypothetical protein